MNNLYKNLNIFRALIAVVLVFHAFNLNAQVADYPSVNKDYDMVLGGTGVSLQSNDEGYVIKEEGAEWLRLHFKDVNLQSHSYLQITSLQDGTSQKLDSVALKADNYASAFFNGDAVKIQLIRASGEADTSITLDSVDVGEASVGILSRCGPNDDRVPSNDAAIGRVMPIGCTGWIINNRKILTAGHCISSRTQSLHFNIPLSNANGSRNNPGPEHQYTIIQDSIVFSNGNRGDDWAVFEVQNNSQTGLHPFDAQGKFYNIVQNHNASTIRITGFGSDTGSANATQQTHTGPLRSVGTRTLNYTVDTEGGNSGSPVVDEGTGLAVGIHTNGGCQSTGSNFGTSFQNTTLWAAADANRDPNKVGITRVQPTSTTTANRRAMPFVVDEKGLLTSITMYHNGGSGKMQLGVYADNAGLPGSLIAVTPETDTAANTGWQTIQLSSPASVSAGQRIWLAWVYENNPGIFYDTGSPGRANIDVTWSAGANNMPGSFGAATTADFRYSIYATFTKDAGGETGTVGIDTVGASVSVNASRRAMPFTMPEAGEMESVSIYHNGGSGGLILAVYADNNNAPGALLQKTASATAASAEGWQTLPLQSAVSVSASQKVWLAWVFETNPGIRYRSGTPGRAQSSETWSGGMPNTFGASGQGEFAYSIFASYRK